MIDPTPLIPLVTFVAGLLAGFAAGMLLSYD